VKVSGNDGFGGHGFNFYGWARFLYFSLKPLNGVLQVSTSIHKSSFDLELY